MKRSRRHHYIPQFYLRNFAEPMYGNKIYVYSKKTRCWEQRTPHGIAWFPHLYTMFDDRGEKTDEFEKYLGQNIESPAAPAIYNASKCPNSLSEKERHIIAMFIGVTVARTPSMMQDVMQGHISRKQKYDDEEIRLWHEIAGLNYTSESYEEYFKPSLFEAIIFWAKSLRDRLMKWNWTFIQTERDRPFITSDWPVFMEKQNNIHVVTFPISSETALVINNIGEIQTNRDPIADVRAMNRQTWDRASEFIICHKESFIGDDLLSRWKMNT